MRINKLLVTTLFFLAIVSNCNADNVVNTEVKNTVELSSKNNVTTAVGSAKDWNLNESEWNKYIELKNGYQGYLFPSLTPPELLGYFAENDEERNHYAEIYARQEFKNEDRELKFTHAFQEAAIRLYGKEPLIRPFDVSPYNPYKIKNEVNRSISSGDHLVLIIDILAPNYSRLISNAISRIASINGSTLDIYCVNATNDSEIQDWAKKTSIPLDLVSKNKITLNKYEGRIKQISTSGIFPAAYLVKNGKTEMIKMDDV